MPEPRLCAHCSAWMCAADDRWCGRCGESCAQLQLALKPSVLLAANRAPKIMLRIANPTCGPLAVHTITAPPWASVGHWAPLQLGPGETSQIIWIEAKTLGIATPQSGAILVSTSVGVVSAELDIIAEAPAVLVSPLSLEIYPSANPERNRIPVTIQAADGTLRIHQVRGNAGGAVAIAEPMQEPISTSAQCAARIIVQPNFDLLKTHSATTLVVDYAGPNGQRHLEVKVPILVRGAPQLRWNGQHQQPQERQRGSRQPLQFIFTNQDSEGRDGGSRNALLVIESVRLIAPADIGPVEINHAFPLPIRLKGGESVVCDFDLNLESVIPRSGDLFHFTLEVQTNARSLRQQVPLFIRPLKPFDGILAIDFGSSNTSCAVWERGFKPELLALEAEAIVSPTFIRYLNLEEGHLETAIGSAVKDLEATDEVAAAATLSRLKQRLGDDLQDLPVRPRGAARWTTRRAAQAVADYLHQVRQVAETTRGRTFSEFILTHPAVCPLDQYRNLHRALASAFGTTQDTTLFLQEPVAALIPFILRYAEALPSRSQQPPDQTFGYTVASFDLGGGTTDIAVLQVVHQRTPSGTLEIRPRIVSCQGVRFGGEDLTDYLSQSILARAQAVLTGERPQARIIRSTTPAAASEEVLLNNAALRNTAEDFKASLSEEAKAAGKRPRQIILRIQSQPGSAGENYTVPFEKITTLLGSPELSREFMDYAAINIGELAGVLTANATQVEHLDFIQLSGKSAFLPIVQEIVQKAFPTTRIERAGDPKECVVMGACLSRSTRQTSRLRLILPSGVKRTTSSIGMVDADSGTFTAILPLDTEIPADGLVRERDNVWFGEEPVTLWESLGVDLATGGAHSGKGPKKLGSWRPSRTWNLDAGVRWKIRVTLKNFALSVSAIGPNGEQVPFASPDNQGPQ